MGKRTAASQRGGRRGEFTLDGRGSKSQPVRETENKLHGLFIQRESVFICGR